MGYKWIKFDRRLRLKCTKPAVHWTDLKLNIITSAENIIIIVDTALREAIDNDCGSC